MTECISRGIPNVSTIENLITAQSNQYSPLKKGKKEKTNHGKSLYTFIDSDLLPSNSYSKKKKYSKCSANWIERILGMEGNEPSLKLWI